MVAVDAVVNTTNERLQSADASAMATFAAAGSKLADECAEIGSCRTGEAKATNAYCLPARKVGAEEVQCARPRLESAPGFKKIKL